MGAGGDALDLDQLLRQLCTVLGICDAIWQRERLISMRPFSVETFARQRATHWVALGECETRSRAMKYA